MSSGSQRLYRELNSVDEPSGEPYAPSRLVTKHYADDRAIGNRLEWSCLPIMFVNNWGKSHATCVAEDNG